METGQELFREFFLKNHPTRNQILSFLEEKQQHGAHLRELKRELGNPGTSTILHHLSLLEEGSLVYQCRTDHYRIYFSTRFQPAETFALGLRSPRAIRIWRTLLNSCGNDLQMISLKDLSSKCQMPRETVRYHVKKFQDQKKINKIIWNKQVYIAPISQF